MKLKTIYSYADTDGDRIDITDEGGLSSIGSAVLRASAADADQTVLVLLDWRAIDELITALGGTPPTRKAAAS